MAHEEADSERTALGLAMKALSDAHVAALNSGEPMVFVQDGCLVRRDESGRITVLRTLHRKPRVARTYRLR